MKTIEQKEEQSVVISDEENETSKAKPKETAKQIPETIAVPDENEKRDRDRSKQRISKDV